MNRTLRDVTTLLGSGALAALVFATPAIAVAQEATSWFDIPSQDLGSALRSFGKSARVPVSFSGDLIRGKRSQSVKGSYPTDAALRLMLEQTGLTFRRGQQGVLFVEPDQAKRARAPSLVRTSVSQVAATDQAPMPVVLAQAEPADAPEEEIRVTATRIIRDGYSAPTPQTVFGEEDLQRAGQINAFTALNQLPSLAGSNSTQTFGTTQSTGTGGLSTLNLRGLGANRTLTLLDNQRVVSAMNTGVTDAGAFPLALVKRVDIVTGGASASWGSDAVAGVVNYVLDHEFVGLKGNLNGGVTTYGDDQQWSLTLTAGTKLLDDKLRIIVSGEYQDNDGIPRGMGSRDWYDATRVLQRTIPGTPAGQPQYIVAPYVNDMRLAPGGIITAGPLTGIAFGPGGAPYNFQYGSLIVSPNMQGGEQSGDVGNNSNLDSVQRRRTFYGRVSYELTPDISVYGTYNHGYVHTFGHSWPGQYRTGTLNIRCDNAFLPTSVTAACATNNITSFALGSYIADLPDSMATNTRIMDRFTTGLDGAFNLFGDRWDVSAYYSHGQSYTNAEVRNGTLNPRLIAAIDAVRAPNGSIVCRSAVAQASGCVPFNIIGTGVASPAAISYVIGTPYIKTWLKQDVAALSLSSEPFSNWAGPISIAFGGEYRKESFTQQSDPASTGNAGDPLLSAAGNNWFTGNFRPASGSYSVWEAFAETVVPLIDSQSIGKLDLNLAVRATDYSLAGYVTTWKIGGTWETPLDGLRIRGLQSRDIRAPNLSELFREPQNITGTVIDRFAPFAGLDQAVNQATVSNIALKPEKSRTRQVGLIYQPQWLPGLSASVDYYDIRVTGAIGSVNPQQTVDLCFQGNQTLCDNITRNGAGAISSIQLKPINLASTETTGLDIEASFRRPASDLFANASGTLTMRALATHVFKYDTDSGIPNSIITRAAGQNTGNIANWRLYATESYSNDKLSLTLIQRYVSPGVINNNFIECTSSCPVPTLNNPTINNNRVDGAFYVDIGGSYKITSKIEFYFKVDNLFDVDPPIAPYVGSAPFLYRPTNAALYDLLGRFYRAGIRFSL
jgi:outer membrane receptor protein involved in Fe transport